MISYYLSMVETEEDRKRVTHVYTTYYSFMCRVASKHLNNQSEVEDVVHDAMLKIIDCLDRIDFSDEPRLKSYIGVMVKHKAIDCIRRRDNKNESLEEYFYVEDESPTPEELVVGEDTYRVILEGIRSLEEKYQSVCMLKYVSGLKEKDIASLLEISENVVAVRLHRARKMLREMLAGVC